MQHSRFRQQRLEVSDRRRITFYAAVFDSETWIKERTQAGEIVTYTEVIRPGAFADSLKEWGEVIANIDHDDSRSFARRSDGSLLLQEDPHGLWASCWVPDGDFGNQILADIEANVLDGCSFKFLPVQNRIEGDLVERLAVSLHDVCLTASPAYAGTEVHLRTQQALQRTNFLFTKLRLQKLKNQRIHKSN